MPKFTRRHYQAVAETIRDMYENSPVIDHRTASLIADRFCIMFRRDNPNFKSSQFIEAAGLTRWRNYHQEAAE